MPRFFTPALFKRLLLLLGCALTPLITHAGSAAPGMLIDFYVMQPGQAIIYTSGSRSSPPACATIANRFAIDATTAAGKAQLAALLVAFSAGKMVEFVGTGTCSFWGDTESVNYFHVLP